MQKMFLVFSFSVLCFFLSGLGKIQAEDEAASDANWKQELRSDKQQIQEQRQGMLQDAQAAREEEAQLRQQIKAAFDAGDIQTVQKLKDQLRSMHQENLQEKMQDKQEMQEAKQDFRSDIKEAHQEGYLKPKKDWDNNPPGPRGGEGTNWENKPGPRGGPGTSPDRRPSSGAGGRPHHSGRK